MNITDICNIKQIKELQSCALNAKLCGQEKPRLNADYLERDGRKQKKLVRQLCENGLVNEDDERYFLNVDAIIQTIDAIPVDLRQLWDDLHQKNWNEDFIRSTQLENGQLKTLIAKNDVQFFVVSDAPFRWTSYRFSEDSGDPVENKGEPWWGPFSKLDSAIECRNRASKQFCKGSTSYEIVLTTPALRKHVEQILFNEKIDALFSINLLWGFEKLEIATTNDLYYPLNDGEERRKPRISVSLDDGIVFAPRGTSFGDKSEDWENNLAKSLERHRHRIEESQRTIELLNKIDTNIQKYGGWSKFKADYREALIKAVRHQESS